MKYIAGIVLFFFLSLSLFAANYTIKSEAEAASYLAQLGIITNQDANPELYRLSDGISRAETMKIIAKLSGQEMSSSCNSTFSDVSSSGWECKYIMWALGKGYISQNATFRPSENITKTEAMKLILKVQGIPKIANTQNWQEDCMKTALAYGIISQAYSDYDAQAKRGWIFQTTTATLEQINEIRENLISDEAL